MEKHSKQTFTLYSLSHWNAPQKIQKNEVKQIGIQQRLWQQTFVHIREGTQSNPQTLLVSVNYNDFLDFLLPKNKTQFDEIIVLTIESDVECQKICEKHDNVRCLAFDDSVIKKHNKNFN